jgi:predicted CoA-binding protein
LVSVSLGFDPRFTLRPFSIDCADGFFFTNSAAIRCLVLLVLGLVASPVTAAAMSSNLGRLWLKSATSWAVIGDVLNAKKPASRVVSTLREAGKTVHLINPRDKTGECFAGLSDVGAPIEVIDLCINHVEGLKQMEQAAALGIKKVFIQPGAGSEAILDFCEENNVEVFMGCVMVENGSH